MHKKIIIIIFFIVSTFHIIPLYFSIPAPSQSPVAITATVTSSTSARITWSPPPLEAQNGIIRLYEIYLEDERGNATFNSTVESYILTGLRPASQYRVRVAAYTVEIGPKSDYTDFVTTEDSK